MADYKNKIFKRTNHYGRFHIELFCIGRETKTQYILENRIRIRKESLQEVGVKYSHSTWALPTDESIREYETFQTKQIISALTEKLKSVVKKSDLETLLLVEEGLRVVLKQVILTVVPE